MTGIGRALAVVGFGLSLTACGGASSAPTSPSVETVPSAATDGGQSPDAAAAAPTNATWAAGQFPPVAWDLYPAGFKDMVDEAFATDCANAWVSIGTEMHDRGWDAAVDLLDRDDLDIYGQTLTWDNGCWADIYTSPEPPYTRGGPVDTHLSAAAIFLADGRWWPNSGPSEGLADLYRDVCDPSAEEALARNESAIREQLATTMRNRVRDSGFDPAMPEDEYVDAAFGAIQQLLAGDRLIGEDTAGRPMDCAEMAAALG